jgi:hypothetical protein
MELEQVRLICESNVMAKGDQGDVARAIRYLSTAHEMKGEKDKAEELREQAEDLRRAVQGPHFDSLPDTEYNYNLMVWPGHR